MLFLFLFLLSLLLIGASLLVSDNDASELCAFVGSVLGFIAFAALLISACVGYTGIVSAETQLTASHRTEVILNARAQTIGATLKDYLTVQYPSYEQATIDRVLKAGPDLILLKFPELQTADTFIKYADSYTRLRSAVYAQQTRRTKLQAKIDSIRHNHLLNVQFFLP